MPDDPTVSLEIKSLPTISQTLPTGPLLMRSSKSRMRATSTVRNDYLWGHQGAKAVVNPGETVFIKPNMVTLPWAHLGRNPFVIGECTKAEIVIAVAEECLRAGAAEVIVGDGSQMPRFSWEQATTLDGSTSLAAEAQRLSSAYKGNVRLVCLDADSPEWAEVPSRTGLGKIAISSLVAWADRVISTPLLKTHQWAQLTLSLKNFVGVTPLARYGANPEGAIPRIILHTTSEGIEQVFLDIAHALRPDLAVIDASICVEANGPSVGNEGGVTVDMKDRLGSWLLLASTDLVAADATAARVINHDVSGVRQLRMAYEQGLGEVREDLIEMIGERLDDLRVDWVPAEPAEPAGLGGWGYLPPGDRLQLAWHPMTHRSGAPRVSPGVQSDSMAESH